MEENTSKQGWTARRVFAAIGLIFFLLLGTIGPIRALKAARAEAETTQVSAEQSSESAAEIG